jgi:hypothetical protein
MILAAFMTRAILAVGQQEIQIVASDIVLCQVDDCLGQTRFSVVIRCLLADIADQLGNLKKLRRSTTLG